MSVREIRLLIVTLLVLAGVLYGGYSYREFRNKMDAAEGHETYVESIENREQVSSAAHTAYGDARASAMERERRLSASRAESTRITNEVANESQAVRDFFDARIPDELRDADRQASEFGRLEGGDRAR